MQNRLPARAAAGLYLLLAVALVSSLSFLLDSIAYYKQNGGELTGSSGYIARFEALRRDLPAAAPGSTRIGYWTNAGDDPGDLEYHLTQFALAPVIVEKSANAALVVGNIAKNPKPEELRQLGLELVKDYGLGVVLYRKAAAPAPAAVKP